MPVDPRIQRILDGPLTSKTELRFAPKRGYAQPPGTGPIGETCRSCRHARWASDERTVWSCDLVREWTPLPIDLTTASCGRWGRSPA